MEEVINDRTWKPPTMDVKLNTDDFFHYNTKIRGVGGVLRDTEGNWLIGFSASINVSTAFEAEVMALILGLEMARKMNLHISVVATDSMQLCNAIHNSVTNKTNLICTCRDLLLQASMYKYSRGLAS